MRLLRVLLASRIRVSAYAVNFSKSLVLSPLIVQSWISRSMFERHTLRRNNREHGLSGLFVILTKRSSARLLWPLPADSAVGCFLPSSLLWLVEV